MRLVTLLTIFLFGATMVHDVDCDSALVLFVFPRLVFGYFHDELVKSRDVISSYYGVLEALSYKVLHYPLMNTEDTYGLCVISFHTTQYARVWLRTDPLVTRRDDWSYGQDVSIVLVSLTLSRHYPFSLYRKAHIIAFLTPEGNSTEFSSDVLPEMTRIYSKYGGNDMAKATTAWEHVIGEAWDSNSTGWVFYGPMADIDSVIRMFRSEDIMNITSEFPTLVKNMQIYGIESFFNTGSRANIHQGTILFLCFCILLLW